VLIVALLTLGLVVMALTASWALHRSSPVAGAKQVYELQAYAGNRADRRYQHLVHSVSLLTGRTD
jgi:uncharacterized membrane protein